MNKTHYVIYLQPSDRPIRRQQYVSLFISAPEGSLGIQAEEHPDPGVCGRGGFPDVHLYQIVTSDSKDLKHRVITNPPEHQGPELAEAPENPLEDV